MKEIGGYIEFEHYKGNFCHESAIALNCGRAALEYLIRAKEIKRIYLPYFCCDSVAQPCRKCSVDITFYHVDKQFTPVLSDGIPEDAWLYIVNYYGQLNNEKLSEYKARFTNLIIDNAQAYFQMPISGVDTLYTCRKFFGVSDGAFLYTDAELDIIEQDESFNRMHFLLGRHERTANEFYSEYAANNKLFVNEPIKRMSKLTENLLRGIDYKFVKERRWQNFEYLHRHFSRVNRLQLVVPDGAFMYPLYVDGGPEIRKRLQEKKIYVPTLWPDVFNLCNKTDIEYNMAKDILPLPVDQRYDEEEMNYIVVEVLKCLN